MLAFEAGKFDLTFPGEVTIPLLKEVKSQAPNAICEVRPTNVSTNLIVNRDKPPFDNPDLQRALALALDRKSFIDILSEATIADFFGCCWSPLLPPSALRTDGL
jgi:peptide/nickel transport system substrate-binding protein